MESKPWLLINFKKIIMKYIVFILSTLILLSCKKERPQLGDPPSDNDAKFTYKASSTSANVIDFTANNSNLQCMWDFGNGVKKNGARATAMYPYAGEYTVTLEVFGKGGSKKSQQKIVIANDDISLLDNPYYNSLTGGPNGNGFKVWYIDSSNNGHFGVGPDPISALGNTPEWWSASPNDKAGCGMYNDRYVFYLNAFKFDMLTQFDVYVHNSLAGNFPGSFQNLGDYTAPYNPQIGATWQLNEGEMPSLTFSSGSFIGFYTGVQTYNIVDITDSTMFLQFKHHAGGLYWYLRLKAIK
jgi:hypothetical protein